MPFNRYQTLCCLIFLTFLNFLSASTVKAEAGVIDLRLEDFSRPYSLDGDWSFRGLEDSSDTLPTVLAVPGDWSDLLGKTQTAGEYSLSILLPEDSPGPLSLLLPSLMQILELSINGEMISCEGCWEQSEVGFTRTIISLPAGKKLDLQIRLKNTAFRRGGLFKPLLIGRTGVIRNLITGRIIVDSILIGILFSVGIFHLFLYFYSISYRSSLFLGLTSCLMALRGFFSGELIFRYFVAGISWNVSDKIGYLTLYGTALFMTHFLKNLFSMEKPRDRIGVRVLSMLAVILIAATILMPIHLVSLSIYVLQGFGLLVFLFNLKVVLHGLYDKKMGADLILAGTIFFLILVSVDIFLIHSFYTQFSATQIGMTLFILFQSMALSQQYGEAYHRAETLTLSLEEEVRQRTTALEDSNRDLKKEVSYRKRMEELLRELSTTDPLTGICNRLKINEELNKTHQLALRYGGSYGIIMFDVDNFKLINDRFGHGEGDRVLKEIVKITQEQIRDSDIFSRWGGEEFLILLPQIQLEGAVEAAERIRVSLEQASILEGTSVTASFGVVVFEDPSIPLNELLVRVDEKLYKAKGKGRNCVVSG